MFIEYSKKTQGGYCIQETAMQIGGYPRGIGFPVVRGCLEGHQDLASRTVGKNVNPIIVIVSILFSIIALYNPYIL